MDHKFQLFQRNFMDQYYQEFEHMEENQLTSLSTFNEQISLVGKHIEEELLEQIPMFNMEQGPSAPSHPMAQAPNPHYEPRGKGWLCSM